MNGSAGVRLVVAAAVATALLGAAGCADDGADDPYAVPEEFQDYCEAVEEQRPRLGAALETGGRASGLIEALPIFEALAAEAPEDIADEWDVVIDRIHDLVDALDAAGVDPAGYDRRNPPSGLDQEQQDAIDAAAVALVSQATGRAMIGVEQHARDVCKTQLAP